MTLFSDDEVVAVAAGVPTEFPLWLPTVAREPGETMGAVLRGARSLFLRGLAESGEGRFDVSPTAAEPLAPFLAAGAGPRCFSLSTFRMLPVASGGARVFVDAGADAWRLDEVSSFGVHAIRASSADEFSTHAAAFLDHADPLYPADGGPGDGGRAISVFSAGLVTELVLKTSDGFVLLGPRGRDDLTVAIPGSEFALREIGRDEARERVEAGPGAA